MMKKLFIFSAFLVASTTFLQADEFDDDFLFDSNPDDFRQCDATPLEVVEFLTTPPVNLQDFLENNFYLRTNPVTVRPLFDLPTLHPLRLDLCVSNNRFAITPFFQQMRKAFLSPCSPFLNSYLAITNPDFLGELDRIAEEFQITLPVTSIFPLLANIKLEERRMGGMFTWQHRHDCYEWRIQVPLYFIEHNFFLTEQEQESIENSPLIQQLRERGFFCGDEDMEAFFRQHLVNDILGFGDIYAQFLFDIIANDCFDAQLGIELILPSAIELKRGLIGRGFCNCPPQPNFSWLEIFCLLNDGQAEEAQAIGLDFATGALDRLTEVAGHTRLGEEHFALGFLAETFSMVGDNVGWHNELRVRYIFPGNENRFFRNIRTPAEFDRDWTNPTDATENLNFLDLQTVLFLYPPAVKVRVQPGSIVEFSSALEYACDCWHLHAGYDIWHQSREVICGLACPNGSLIPLDLQAGRKSAALQQKVFGRAMFDFTACHFDWHIGIFGDATIGTLGEFQSTKGIGEDWTVGIDFSMFF